jgi:hypothetical protein
MALRGPRARSCPPTVRICEEMLPLPRLRKPAQRPAEEVVPLRVGEGHDLREEGIDTHEAVKSVPKPVLVVLIESEERSIAGCSACVHPAVVAGRHRARASFWRGPRSRPSRGRSGRKHGGPSAPEENCATHLGQCPRRLVGHTNRGSPQPRTTPEGCGDAADDDHISLGRATHAVARRASAAKGRGRCGKLTKRRRRHARVPYRRAGGGRDNHPS